MSKEIEQAVFEFVESCGVDFSVTYVRETKNDGWQCDQWAVTLEKPGHFAEFDYYTGLGRRTKIEDTEMGRRVAHDLRNVKRNTLEWEDARKQFCKPKHPHVASVLHSLIMDAQGATGSFEDWCGDYGFDTDSRKALDAYEACQKTGKKLRNLFSASQIETLSDTLKDY